MFHQSMSKIDETPYIIELSGTVLFVVFKLRHRSAMILSVVFALMSFAEAFLGEVLEIVPL